MYGSIELEGFLKLGSVKQDLTGTYWNHAFQIILARVYKLYLIQRLKNYMIIIEIIIVE